MTKAAALGVEWDSDLRVLAVLDAAGRVAAELAFVLPGTESEPEFDDSDVLVVETGTQRSRLGVLADEDRLSVRLVVDNLTAEPVELSWAELALYPAPGFAGWTWTTGPEAVVAVWPTDASASGLLFRLRSGYLLGAEGPAAFEYRPHLISPTARGSGFGSFLLSERDAALRPHGRLTFVLDVLTVPGPDAVGAVLPPWLPQTVAALGEHVEFAEPDRAIVAGPGVLVEEGDPDVLLLGGPGAHQVALHGPRGIDRLTITWAPSVHDVLDAAAEMLIGKSARRSGDAAGFVVAEALARELASDEAWDWLESVDWLARDTLLAEATAGLVAAASAERRAFDDVWRLLAKRPATVGYGLVVARLAVAGLGAFGDVPAVSDTLLARRAEDADARLELALLRADGLGEFDRRLEGALAVLGGSLPGRPLGLSGVRAAYLASLLRLTPESWRGRISATEALTKTERLVLADNAAYLGGESVAPVPPPDALAWLLLGQLGM